MSATEPYENTDAQGGDRAMRPWDIETDPANPQPNIWPECASCSTPWVWRFCLTMSGGKWLWTRDCEHKAQPEMMTANGPYEVATDAD